MKNIYDIAVIGAGIAGLTAASLFKQQGHNVTIFEKHSESLPVGAGLVLQQTGLAVLANLNLDIMTIEKGAIINRFLGKNSKGHTVYDLLHENLSPNFFSVGIHRHTITKLLREKANFLNIPFIKSFETLDVALENDKHALISSDHQRIGRFDLIVDASGTHSVIRDKYASIAYKRPFAYGALWGVCESREDLPPNILQQRFHKAKVGIGIIPIGKKHGCEDINHVAVHWSIRHKDYPAWRAAPLDDWKVEVVKLYADAENIVSRFNDHDDLTLAVYSDIALKKFYSNRIVFIGDSCHSISPRLGQGANLGLVDALILSRALAAATTIENSLAIYDASRKNHVKFYQRASRLMNFLFQSDNSAASFFRDVSFNAMYKVPYTHRQMLTTIGGIRTGLFSVLDLGSLHPDYAFLR